MILLSPFLTVLRVVTADGALIHADLWSQEAGSSDMSFQLPDPIDAPAPMVQLPGFVVRPADRARMVVITRDAATLYVHPAARLARLRNASHGPFEFLMVTEDEIAQLRDLFAHSWTMDGPAGAAEATLLPCGNFRIDLGEIAGDLGSAMPRTLADGQQCELPTTNGSVILTKLGDARREILMRQAPAYFNPPKASEAAFREHSDQTLYMEAGEEVVGLPITVCSADRTWLYDKSEEKTGQRTGRIRCVTELIRASDKYVMLARHLEGMVFDNDGVYSETGYLIHLGSGGARHLPLPQGMRQEGERLFVDHDALARAPVLQGPHVVCCAGTLSNYYHWLIDCMLPLHAMLPHVPENATLLLPGTLRSMRQGQAGQCDHHDILRAFGFDSLPTVEIDAPYCRVEDVYWLNNGWIHNMPAAQIRGLRARIMARRPAASAGEINLYVARRGARKVQNPGPVEAFLTQRGFEKMYFDEFSFDEQVDIFARAKWVVSPHGAELANLLFCRPGTKVLELAPDAIYRPYYSYMCNKLELTHGVLPCATDNGQFHGELMVDMHKFTALFRMLKQHL